VCALPEATMPEQAATADRASGLREGQHRCRTTDGLDLYCHSWTPKDPRGVLVIVHGLAEHGGRYRETAEFFAAQGWSVFAGDLRGHGLSPDAPGGGRVHVRRFTDYFLDVQAFTGLARQANAGLPMFLFGHSMGGLIAISYLLQHPVDLAGAVISSPALGIHPESRPPLALRLLVSLLSRLAPRASFPSELDTRALSHDPAVIQAYVEDPLVSRKVSARWYAEMLKAMKLAYAQAGALRLPVLLMQSGADRLVDPAAPARWAAGAPAGLVELVTWEGFYHEMFNELGKDQVRGRTLGWLREHLPPAAAPVG
jgi:alpha-beta hydrolase superfamily lysophospholipase